MGSRYNRQIINDHGYADFRLSVTWATCNVWGQADLRNTVTILLGENYYGENNCETYNKDIGDIDGTYLDVVHVKWGSPWRMPTCDEFQELIDNCDYEWTEQNRVVAFKVMSKRIGKSIFLPAAGLRHLDVAPLSGGHGYYWSFVLCVSGTQDADSLNFISGYRCTYWFCLFNGHSVRPVSE